MTHCYQTCDQLLPLVTCRGEKGGPMSSKNNSEDEDSSSDAESETVSSSYLANIGRVVWAENTDKVSYPLDHIICDQLLPVVTRCYHV